MSAIGGKLLCLSESERAEFESGGGWGIAVRALRAKGESRRLALERLKVWMDSVVDVSDFDSYEVMA